MLLYGLACAVNKLAVKLFLVGKCMKKSGEKGLKRKQAGLRIIVRFSQVGVELHVHTLLESFQVHLVYQYLSSSDVLFLYPTELFL